MTIKRLISGTEETGCEISIENDIVDIVCTDGGLTTHTESISLKYFKEVLGLK